MDNFAAHAVTAMATLGVAVAFLCAAFVGGAAVTIAISFLTSDE